MYHRRILEIDEEKCTHENEGEEEEINEDEIKPEEIYEQRKQGISIMKWMRKKYGQTKGCKGCLWATGNYGSRQAHNENCKKRFLELSDEPGNEDLKSKINKDFERMTQDYLEREGRGKQEGDSYFEHKFPDVFCSSLTLSLSPSYTTPFVILQRVNCFGKSWHVFSQG